MSIDVVDAFAELTNKGIMDSVFQKYKIEASSWASIMQYYAERLFLSLATISMVWTFAQLLFRRSSIAEFFGEFIRFLVFTGLFLWFLRNAPQIAEAIIQSLQQIGSQASGLKELTPSTIVEIGFKIYNDVCVEAIDNMSIDNLGSILMAFILALIILIVLALVSINMLLQLCAAWVLAYAGIFFLGFGGSRWTSDMAINYFKTVLGVGASLMTMTLLVGVGTSIINETMGQMTGGINQRNEMGILMVVAITLFMLVDKLPAMVAGIINGSSIGASMGVGSFGAGAAVGAGAVAMGAMKMGGTIGRTGMASVSKAALGGVRSLEKAGGHALQAMQQGSGAFGGMSQASGQGVSVSRAMGVTTAFATEVGKSLGSQAKNAIHPKKEG